MSDVLSVYKYHPDLEIKEAQGERISFRTSDLKGSYEILIRGFDSGGKYLEKRIPFTVE